MLEPNSKIFEERREIFLKKLNGKAAIIPSSSLVKHHADCEYPFRQDSNFWYLTGFDEPDSIALFLSHKPKGENWFTIGVSTNIIDASFKALVDSLDYKLFKDNAPASL